MEVFVPVRIVGGGEIRLYVEGVSMMQFIRMLVPLILALVTQAYAQGGVPKDFEASEVVTAGLAKLNVSLPYSISDDNSVFQVEASG